MHDQNFERFSVFNGPPTTHFTHTPTSPKSSSTPIMLQGKGHNQLNFRNPFRNPHSWVSPESRRSQRLAWRVYTDNYVFTNKTLRFLFFLSFLCFVSSVCLLLEINDADGDDK